MEKNKTVDEYILKYSQWQEELIALRKIMQATELVEAVKWGAPVYTVNSKNIVGLGAFKSYFGLWFFQGALLSDKPNKLTNAQEGKTVAMRQWRFNSFDEIDNKLITEYVNDAIDNQKAGKEIKPQKKPLILPELLQQAINSNKELAASFDSLSLTCKREYTDHIREAKREDTKQKRLEKIIPMIISKVGLHDKYKNC